MRVSKMNGNCIKSVHSEKNIFSNTLKISRLNNGMALRIYEEIKQDFKKIKQKKFFIWFKKSYGQSN